MKISKYLSIISLVIAVIIILLKINFDITFYVVISGVLEDGDVSPAIVAGFIKVIIPCLLPSFIALILSIIGFRRRNGYRKAALWISISSFVYLLIPVGFLLAFI